VATRKTEGLTVFLSPPVAATASLSDGKLNQGEGEFAVPFQQTLFEFKDIQALGRFPHLLRFKPERRIAGAGDFSAGGQVLFTQ
jgi:hypothetical protein